MTFQQSMSVLSRKFSTSLCRKRYKIPIKKLQDGSRVRVSKITGEEWISTVGLEVHAQIAARSKLFSGAGLESRASVNTQVALLDASIPGTLPVLNSVCVMAGLKTSLALNCKISEVSTFDRKHYFYSDLPTGYQITQQRNPIAKDGWLRFQVLKSSTVPETYNGSAGIVQIQLEQDSGKSLHDTHEEKSLIDLNRCGSGLMEIVFKPDLFDGEESAALIKELSLILQRLGTCTCHMEEGNLRVDANISVRRPGEPLGIRTEVKNLNSIKSVVHAIENEIERQINVLSGGGKIENETRSFDVNLKKTVKMRDKEVKQDYRFMHEPNLPPLRIQLEGPSKDKNIICLDDIRESIPEMPEETRQKLLKEFNMPLTMAHRFVNEPELLSFFYDAVKLYPKDVVNLGNMILSTLEYLRNRTDRSIEQLRSTPSDLVKASNMSADSKLTNDLIRKAFLLFEEDHQFESLDDVIKSKGWLKTFRDPILIESLAQLAIDENSKKVRRYIRGNEKSFDFIAQTIIQSTLEIDKVLAISVLREKLDQMKKDISQSS